MSTNQSVAETTTRRNPVRLTFRDGEVMVTPRDQDIFFISAVKATEACTNVIRAEQRVSRFTDELLRPLAEWCERHKDKVSACYVLLPESAVLPVYVVGAKEVYDFALTEELSRLAVWFNERGWSVHLSQLPLGDADQLAGYFHPDKALQVYG